MLTGPARPHTAEIQLSANAGSVLKHRWVGSCSNWTRLLWVFKYSSVISSLNFTIHRFGCYPINILIFSLSHLHELEAPSSLFLIAGWWMLVLETIQSWPSSSNTRIVPMSAGHLILKGHSPSLWQWSPCLLSTCNLCLACKGLVLIRSPGNSPKVYRTICPVQEKLAFVKLAAIIFQECFQTHRESPGQVFNVKVKYQSDMR